MLRYQPSSNDSPRFVPLRARCRVSCTHHPVALASQAYSSWGSGSSRHATLSGSATPSGSASSSNSGGSVRAGFRGACDTRSTCEKSIYYFLFKSCYPKQWRRLFNNAETRSLISSNRLAGGLLCQKCSPDTASIRISIEAHYRLVKEWQSTGWSLSVMHSQSAGEEIEPTFVSKT